VKVNPCVVIKTSEQGYQSYDLRIFNMLEMNDICHFVNAVWGAHIITLSMIQPHLRGTNPPSPPPGGFASTGSARDFTLLCVCVCTCARTHTRTHTHTHARVQAYKLVFVSQYIAGGVFGNEGSVPGLGQGEH